MRIVLDTNALVRAHDRSSAQARELLEEILKHGHDLVTSNAVLAEVTRVLRYPRFQQLYGLTDGELLRYIQFLQHISYVVALDPQYRAPLRDINDLIVLQTAECGDADELCTHDDDFHGDAAVIAYCASRGIALYDEATLLDRLRRESQ